jgi:hypothetical protein
MTATGLVHDNRVVRDTIRDTPQHQEDGMEIVFGNVGDEFVIDGRIYLTIVAITADEVLFAVSTPECVAVECLDDSE